MNTASLVILAISALAPIVVGLITKSSTPSGIKAAALAGIAIAIGVGNGFLNTPAGTVWEWKTAVIGAGVAWVLAVATHYGLYKPTGVTAKIQATAIADRA